MRSVILAAAFLVVMAFAQPSPPAHMRASTMMLPKFLQGASPDACKEFWAIVDDEAATVEQTQEKLKAWAAKQGGEVQAQFEEAGKKVKEMMKDLDEAIEKSSISEGTKNAFKELEKITSDDNQTFGQQMKKVDDYMESLSDETREEIHKFMENVANHS